jgi:hypothetical protein
MDRPTARNGEIRSGWSLGMPRAPISGAVSGVVGVLWAAAGLVLAAWAATAALDEAKGYELAMGSLGNAGVKLPWPHEHIVGIAMSHLPVVGVAAAVALLLAWSGLRRARLAFRPVDESQDGKGELRLATLEPRVGRPFEGSIMLRDAPSPGEEFDVTLTALTSSGVTAWRGEQKARARPGAHGVNLPFRFDVPISATAGSGGHRWRLEFAPVGRKLFGRSAFDVSLGPPSEAQVRMASVAAAHAPAKAIHAAEPQAHVQEPQAHAQEPQAHAQGHVEHIEKLYGALGGKLTDRQREQIRAKLSGKEALALKEQLEGLRRIRPDHVKLFKYAAIGAVLFFFVLPFVFSVLGMIFAAIFTR